MLVLGGSDVAHLVLMELVEGVAELLFGVHQFELKSCDLLAENFDGVVLLIQFELQLVHLHVKGGPAHLCLNELLLVFIAPKDLRLELLFEIRDRLLRIARLGCCIGDLLIRIFERL